VTAIERPDQETAGDMTMPMTWELPRHFHRSPAATIAAANKILRVIVIGCFCLRSRIHELLRL
jgi:hypothetical protein